MKKDEDCVRLGRKYRYQAWLVPYAEGTLDDARTAHLEAQLARDPALASEAHRVRAAVAQLRRAAAQSMADTDPRLALDPAPLWPGVQKRLTAKPRRLPRSAPWAGGICAASLALGALLLHGLPHGIGTVQTPPPVPVRVANTNDASAFMPETAARMRRKKAGRRTHSRPARPAPGASEMLPPARLAARSPAPPPEASAPALPALAPAPAAPPAHAAVALEDGSAQFRLASPVPKTSLESRPRPASDMPTARPQADAPRQDTPAPTDSPAQAQNDPTTTRDGSASAPAAASLTLPRYARKTHRHRPRRRHASRRPAAPAAVPAPASSPATPTAVPPSPHSSRAI